MPKLKNRCFNVDAILKGATIGTYGKTFAFKSPYFADGFSFVNIETPAVPATIVPFLEGDDTRTVYAVGSNITKLCSYCFSPFPNLKEVYLFYNGVVQLDDNFLAANPDVDKLYVHTDDLATYQSTYAGKSFVNFFDVIIEDYTLNIRYETGSKILSQEVIDNYIAELTAYEKAAVTKVVVDSEFENVDILWYYNFSAIPNLNSNIWWGMTRFDFTVFYIAGSGTLTNEIITNAFNNNQHLTTIKDIKYSGFSNYDVALTYDYSALTSLEYVWLGNSRYEYDTQTQQWVFNAIYFPLNTFIANIQDKAVAYFDYTGTQPDMSAFTGWDYDWYDNASRTGNPVSMSAHKRYYLQLKPLNNSITILGSGTLTSALTTASIWQVKSSDLASVNTVVVGSEITTFENDSLNDLETLSNWNTLDINGTISSNLYLAYSIGQNNVNSKLKTVNYYGTTIPAQFTGGDTDTTSLIGIEYFNANNVITFDTYYSLTFGGTTITSKIKNISLNSMTGISINNWLQLSFSKGYDITTLEFPNLQQIRINLGHIYFQKLILPSLTYLGCTDNNGTINCSNANSKIFIETSNCVMGGNKRVSFHNNNTIKFYFKAEYLVNYITGTNWSAYASQMIGYLDYTDTIPTFIGYTPTWYSDEDCLTPISTSEFVSGNRYFVKLS